MLDITKLCGGEVEPELLTLLGRINQPLYAQVIRRLQRFPHRRVQIRAELVSYLSLWAELRDVLQQLELMRQKECA